MDLIGSAAEESTELAKIPEAKTSKSIETYTLIGEFISFTKLNTVLESMAEVG